MFDELVEKIMAGCAIEECPTWEGASAAQRMAVEAASCIGRL